MPFGYVFSWRPNFIILRVIVFIVMLSQTRVLTVVSKFIINTYISQNLFMYISIYL